MPIVRLKIPSPHSLLRAISTQCFSYTGADALVAAMAHFNIKTVYGLPGETTTPIQEALSKAKSIEFLTATHEGESGFSAFAAARTTNTPSFLCTTGGPGLDNARIAIASTYAASRPMVVLAGQVASSAIPFGVEASQYADVEAYRSITKRLFRPRTPQEVVDHLTTAFKISQEGRPGPVLIELPVDVQAAKSEVRIPTKPVIEKKIPDSRDVASAVREITSASKIVIIAGEMVNVESAHNQVTTLAERLGAAIITPLREQDAVPNDHPHYVGCPGFKLPPHIKHLWDDMRASGGTVIIIGHRIAAETSLGYKPDWLKDMRLVHIYPDFSAISPMKNFYVPHSAIESHVIPAINSIEEQLTHAHYKAPDERLKWVESYHNAQIAFQKPANPALGVDREQIMATMQELLPKDACIITGSGNHTSWVREMWVHRVAKTQIGPMDGAMGLGVPGAIGMAKADPSRTTVVFVGDGDFAMTGPHTLQTTQKYEIPLLIVLDNNGQWGGIAMNQYLAGMPHSYGSETGKPDYSKLIEAFGGTCWQVKKTEEFKAAFKAAHAAYKSGGIAVVEISTDPRDIIRDAARRLPDGFIGR